jgi:hypothetical protein
VLETAKEAAGTNGGLYRHPQALPRDGINLKGRVAVIAGGAGIGEGIIKSCHRAGPTE